MSNQVFFQLTDFTGVPLTGSKFSLRPLGITGSISSIPIIIYSDSNGTASYSNVFPGIYETKFTNANAISQSVFGASFTNYDPTINYVQIPSLTGSLNGWNYIVNNISASYITGSGAGTESDNGTSIPQMCNTIRNFLEDWAIQNQGAAFIAEEAKEKINIGFQNCVGPKVLIVFKGEQGDGELYELTGRVRRDFDIVIQRGKLMSDPRNSQLTTIGGSSRAFYTLVEECRDVVRGIVFTVPTVYSPVIYNNTRPFAQEGWMMDSYILSFTVLCQIPRMQNLPPQLTNTPQEIGAIDPLSMLPNGFPM